MHAAEKTPCVPQASATSMTLIVSSSSFWGIAIIASTSLPFAKLEQMRQSFVKDAAGRTQQVRKRSLSAPHANMELGSIDGGGDDTALKLRSNDWSIFSERASIQPCTPGIGGSRR